MVSQITDGKWKQSISGRTGESEVMGRIILRALNGIYGWVIGIAVAASAFYAGYAILDNAQVYQAATDVQDQIRQLKPTREGESGPSFEQLRALNGEVTAWLTVDGTNIDYPVVQGDTDLDYMNKDVYGNYSLAGSIFMDVRNSADFSDNYTLIYGHNMDEHLMFGDLALFKDKTFFTNNTTATLLLPGESRGYQVAAVLQLSAGTEEIFNPDLWKTGLNSFGEFLEKNSIWYQGDIIDSLKNRPDRMQVLSLVTCSDGSTNDRTILILVREKPEEKKPATGGGEGGSSHESSDPATTTVVKGAKKKTTETTLTGSQEMITETADTGAAEDDDGVLNAGRGKGGKGVMGAGLKKTGDTENTRFWLTVMGVSVALILVFEIVDRRRKKEEDFDLD